MGAPDLWREQLDAVAQGQRRRRQARPAGRRPGPAACCSAWRATTASCGGRPSGASRTRSRLDELLVELRRPEVKAAILAEDDLPAGSAPPVRGPHRDRRPSCSATSSRSATRSTTSRPATSRSPASPRPPARDPWEVLYDHLAAGELHARRLHQLRPGDQRPAARDARASRHRGRPLRRRRPREDDLRRVGADLPAHPLGARPHPRANASPLETVGPQAGRGDRRGRRPHRPGHASRWARRPTST